MSSERAAGWRAPPVFRTCPMRIDWTRAIGAVALCALAGFISDDALVAISVLVLVVGIKLVSTDDGMYVLPAAYAFHWLETSIGLFYRATTGRETVAFYNS